MACGDDMSAALGGGVTTVLARLLIDMQTDPKSDTFQVTSPADYQGACPLLPNQINCNLFI